MQELTRLSSVLTVTSRVAQRLETSPWRRLPIMLAAACAVTLSACVHAGAGSAPAPADAEQATARYLASIQDSPQLLLAFARDLPKGADLHNHLSGAVYAEHFLEWAAQDGRCIDRRTMAAVAPPCDVARGMPAAADAMQDQQLYDQVIDAWSMRDFVPASGRSGHDHFFDTFEKFGLAEEGHRGDMLALAMQQAAREHVLYLELMVTPAEEPVLALAHGSGWVTDLAQLHGRLTAGMPAVVAAASAELDQAEQQMRADLRCDTPRADAGCEVQVRFLYQVLRGLPPEDVFAQLLLGFELASHDPRVVGLNMVMPEDGHVSMRDFRLHMSMLDFLHARYPAVHIALHAGELTQGLVPPEGLGFHIRASVEQGHAERIGHGVDIMHEEDPVALLGELARRHVLVEICLTSNKTILGVDGDEHPLPTYLRAQVPVALATDDAGVSRSSFTGEFVRAVQQYHLSYATLKMMIRASVEHAFLPGTSLWTEPEHFQVVSQCAEDVPGAANPSPACAGFLALSDKAALEWRQEAAFNAFELQAARGGAPGRAGR